MAKKEVNNIGLKIEPPEMVCEDAKCPWHGHLKIRGRIFKGKVVSKSHRTVVVEWDYFNYVPKYERYERRKTKISAHNPACIDANLDDIVIIGECRPLSKTKSFVVLKVVKSKKGETA